MEIAMRAIDVMTTAVVSVKPETTVRETAKIFVEQGISGAPVVDANGKLVGMVSEGDLLHREELDTEEHRRSWWLNLFSSSREAIDYVKSHGQKVQDVMTEKVITVDEMTPLAKIADILETNRIKRVPVMRGDKLVGIVSRSNLIQALASSPDEAKPAMTASDGEIRAMLMDKISGRKWSYIGRNVIVRDGIVHLWGSLWSADEMHATRVAAEDLPGVKGVEEHIEIQPALPGL
jgi:CBS domain-containing protein